MDYHKIICKNILKIQNIDSIPAHNPQTDERRVLFDSYYGIFYYGDDISWKALTNDKSVLTTYFANTTEELRTYVNEAPEGELIYLRPGNYDVDTPIEINKPLTIIGSFNSILRPTSDISPIIISDISKVVIKRIKIDSEYHQNVYNESPITINNSFECLIDQCIIRYRDTLTSISEISSSNNRKDKNIFISFTIPTTYEYSEPSWDSRSAIVTYEYSEPSWDAT